MKKLRKIATAITAFALCATVFTATASAVSADSVASQSISSQATYIGESKAKEIALNNAKIKEADAKYMTCQFEYDDGIAVYDVEFHNNGTEYNYEINAKSGKIIATEKDYYGSNVPSSGGAYVGKADAKEIAFAHAGIAEKDAQRVKVEFDYDDGRAEYNVEFHADSKDYDYEIDALSGDIISYDVENDFSFSDIFFVRWISSIFSWIGQLFN